MNSTAQNFGHIATGVASREAIALVEQVFADEDGRIDAAIFSAIDQGTATAEQALFAFAGKRALARVLLRLRQKDQTGRSAARRQAQNESVNG